MSDEPVQEDLRMKQEMGFFRKSTDARFCEGLVEGQDSDYLYIGCSYSRVSADEIIGAGTGEIIDLRLDFEKKFKEIYHVGV